ncbi:hypothetical protein ID866_8859 [Astraeus odoratus]|nr:hypothetical protein ID866_8859 [Astraeus odoratus]
MLSRWLFTAPALAATCAYLPSVQAFQPGADYGLYKTDDLYNCSGTVPTSNVTVPNSADTLPQIQPLSRFGWEKWDFWMHGTFSMVLRWSQGDESQCDASPSEGKIDVVILDVNGTDIRTTLSGPLNYTDGYVKKLSIGDNTLQWDDSTEWYNMTLYAEGYTMVLDTYSAMLDTFHPNVAGYNGRLSSVQNPSLYGSVPMTRGQSAGYLLTPDKQNITLDGLTVLKHTFSNWTLPQYVAKYDSVVAWGYSTGFLDSYISYQIHETDGTVHQAAYLARAILVNGSRNLFQYTPAIYTVSDAAADTYQLAINPVTQTLNASFAGCAECNDIPYAFNLTVVGTLGEFTDLGGGNTTYYLLNGTTIAPYEGVASSGIVYGSFEVYEAPSSQ